MFADTKQLFERGQILAGMDKLIHDLRETRRALPADEWAEFIEMARADEIRKIVHLCPMTRRSYDKPRGFAGDAVMLDHMYGLGEGQAFYAHPSTLCGQVYHYTVNSAVPRAIRYRRTLIAKLIDEAAASRPNGDARVLSIAAGHVREAELSAAVQSGQLAEFCALDQDGQSTAFVDTVYGYLGITAIEASARDLIRRRKSFVGYDLVYAAGLFDYLDDNLAKRLAKIMLGIVRPGGKVVIANVTPGVPDVGYMEAFMDWFLTYRTKRELKDVFDEVSAQVGAIEMLDDPTKSIAFAVVTRA
jgi:extracellular factor (EF) 3-hydroxypalmitic acid methyl ester biosynthesis protein